MPSRGPIYGAHDNIEQVGTNPGYHGLLRPAGPGEPHGLRVADGGECRVS
jgi:hypothetical protein